MFYRLFQEVPRSARGGRGNCSAHRATLGRGPRAKERGQRQFPQPLVFRHERMHGIDAARDRGPRGFCGPALARHDGAVSRVGVVRADTSRRPGPAHTARQSGGDRAARVTRRFFLFAMAVRSRPSATRSPTRRSARKKRSFFLKSRSSTGSGGRRRD